MNKILPIAHVLGMMAMLFSITMVIPLVISVLLEDDTWFAFVESMAITFIAGAAMFALTVYNRRELHARDGPLLVVMVWVILAGLSTLPLLLSGTLTSFTDAYFETMSGLTTTGSTVISGLDNLPPSINIWRATLHWVGGMGIIVLAVAVLPLLGIGGMQMYKAEAPGPIKDTKLTPRITETAKGLWLVYLGLTLLAIAALKLAGMDWIDAIVHAFSAVATGGFSSHDASAGYFNSPLIEFILMVFMLIGGINFATHFVFFKRHSVRPYAQDSETISFIVVLFISVFGLAVYLWGMGIYSEFTTSLRHAAFNTISVATTTGLATTDYSLWPLFAPLWMLFLCTFSCCSGSTGGGIKMIRARILFKQGLRELFTLIHPNVMAPLKLGKQVIRNQVVFAVLAFIFLYLASITFLVFVLVATGLSFLTAFSAVIACINTTGPGLNELGPATTYAILTDFQTWVCTFAMLLGRLELFTLLVLFTPAFWRK